MLERLRKLSAHVVVASIADIGLTLRQQAPAGLRLVNRVAGRADHIGLRVLASPDIRARNVFGVAAEAGIECLIGSQIAKSRDGLSPAASFYVRLTRPVTPFATRVFRHRSRRNRFEMRIPEEQQRNIRVAGPAGIAPGKPAALPCRSCLLCFQRTAQQASHYEEDGEDSSAQTHAILANIRERTGHGCELLLTCPAPGA